MNNLIDFPSRTQLIHETLTPTVARCLSIVRIYTETGGKTSNEVVEISGLSYSQVRKALRWCFAQGLIREEPYHDGVRWRGYKVFATVKAMTLVDPLADKEQVLGQISAQLERFARLYAELAQQVYLAEGL